MSTNGRKSDNERSSGNGRTTGALRLATSRSTTRPTGWQSQTTRTEPTTRWAAWQRLLRERWKRLLAVEQLWIILFLAGGTWALAPHDGISDVVVEEGTIASRDFVAPRDELILAEDATASRREAARRDVLPVWDLDTAAAGRLEDALGDLFARGRAVVADEGGDSAWDALLAESPIETSANQLAYLRRRGFPTELEAQLRGAVSSLMARGVVAAKDSLLEHRDRGVRLRVIQSGKESVQLDLWDYVGYPEEVRTFLNTEIRGWSGVRASERTQLVDLVVANVSPNVSPNPAETIARQEAAAAAVEPVYTKLRKGQVIVRKGDSVDAAAVRVIRALSAASPRGPAYLLPIFGVLLALGLAVLGLWLGLRREPPGAHRSPTRFSELLLLMLVSIVAGRLAVMVGQALAASFENVPFDRASSYLLAVPFAAPALLAMLLYGRWVALLMSVTYSASIGFVAVGESAWNVVLYSLVGSLALTFWVDDLQFRQRSFTLRAGLVVSVVNCGTTLVLSALAGGFESGPSELAFDLGCALAGGIFVAAVASFMVPLLESAFSLTTAIRLVELGNTNVPLLRRFAFEAPGSFQHSLMVANLAKAGAEAIGADPTLAYTGALYHDIGKVLRPDYFVENQRPGQNRHDKLQPSMSTLILISHVKDGLELAREAHLPQPILDAIEQHHGTRLITFFYHRAVEQQEPGAGEVAEEKFRYPGPRPQSKVMGVLMLADGVEAASRSLGDPSPARLRSVIRAITEDCLRDGQLDETDLTLGDLKKVGDAFQRVLAHIYHRRLDYPGFDFGDKRERRPNEAPVANVAGAPGVEIGPDGPDGGLDVPTVAGQA